MEVNEAVVIRNVTKVYKLYNKPVDRLKEAINPLRRNYHRDFYALKDVSFKVKKGETIGIIGKNGSGKSTLLKMITGVLTPTLGNIEVNGRISALLELGAGFNPEFTGIENIYMNGTIMGYSKEEMDMKLEDILQFADIGDFVYQPVKSYSSGMFARLAFAVSINVDPDILIVDEALSVGDVHFQAKCYRKFDEFKAKGKTILFVSHSLDSIIRYCSSAIVLNEGVLINEGSPKEMVDLYKKIIVNNNSNKEQDEEQVEVILDKQQEKQSSWRESIEVNPSTIEYGDNRARIVDFGIFNQSDVVTSTLLSDELSTFKMRIQFSAEVLNPIFAYSIKDLKGMEIAGTNTWYGEELTGNYNKGDEVVVSFSQYLNLQGGDYTLSLGCTGYQGDELVVYHRLYDVIMFKCVLFKSIIGIVDLKSNIIVQQTKRGGKA